MEIMRFIFSSFWIWLGTLMLAGSILGGLASVVKAVRGPSVHRLVKLIEREQEKKARVAQRQS